MFFYTASVIELFVMFVIVKRVTSFNLLNRFAGRLPRVIDSIPLNEVEKRTDEKNI